MSNTIADNLQRLTQAKSDIADAITAKGGTVNQGDGFEEFAEDIASIPSGGNNNFAKMPQTARAKPYDLCTYALGSSGLYSNLQIISSPIDYRYIWTDGDNVYYSNGLRQYILNVFTWKTKTWNGLTNFSGQNVWTDDDNIYYSSGSVQYVLDKATSTWSTKTWSGLTSFNGSNVHKINNNIYYGTSNALDKSTSTWYSVTWSGYITSPSNELVINNRMAKAKATGTYESGSTYTYPCMCHELTHKWITMHGQYVWSDGTDLYYSCYRDSSSYDNDIHFKLDRDTLSWIPIMFEGFPYTYNTSLDSQNLWEDVNGNFYFSQGYFQYKYDTILDNWVWQTWNGGLQFTGFDGKYIWTDGENIYYSMNSDQYVLDKTTSTWKPKTWTGLTSFNRLNVWTDGENIYYSVGSSAQYVLNKSTSRWTTKTWSGYTAFTGSNVWTDGENFYYSMGSAHYVLDKSTSTWNNKTWTGLTSFNGYNVWSDGDNIYYSQTSNQYVLNKATSTWETKTWTGLTSFNGYNVYKSNDNHLYYMNSSSGYMRIFNTGGFVSKSEWRSKHIDGRYVWTDGEHTYYSLNSNHYVFDSSTLTWSTKTWSGLTSFNGNNVWTDGENIYYSAGSSFQYVLDKTTSTWSTKTWNGFTNFYGASILNFDNDTIFTADSDSYSKINYKLNKSTSTWTSYQFSESQNQYRKTKITPIAVMNNGAYVHSTYSDGTAWINKSGTNVSPISSARLYSGNGFTDNNNLYILDSGSNTSELFAWGSVTSPVSIFTFKDLNDDYMCIYDNTISANNNGPIKYSKRDHTFSRSLSSSASAYSTGLWSDGKRIYYSTFNGYISSSDNKQFMVNSSEKWTNTRSALNYWTDGNNIYYSDGSDQYILDKSTSTWSTKTWTGLTSFYGSNVWTDGTNVYYSATSTQYVLDKSTSTWAEKTWNGLTDFYGQYIWTDGENIYYSQSSSQYVLDKATSTWETKTWTGLTSFNGSSLVSNGVYIMCYSSSSSSFNSRYFLDSTSGSWVLESLWSTSGSGSTLSLFNPQCWSDGTRVYTLSYLWDEPLI